MPIKNRIMYYIPVTATYNVTVPLISIRLAFKLLKIIHACCIEEMNVSMQPQALPTWVYNYTMYTQRFLVMLSIYRAPNI